MEFSDFQVNVAIQALPITNNGVSYALVDDAISVIQKSGLTYVVTPFETVIEGSYSQVMDVIKAIHEKCYEKGALTMLVNLKIQSSSTGRVNIDDKIGKYK